MSLITLCVIAVVVCACLTAIIARPWALAGAGACTALVAAIGVLVRFRAQIAEGEPPSGPIG